MESAFGVEHGGEEFGKAVSSTAASGLFRGILTTGTKSPGAGGVTARAVSGAARPQQSGRGVQLARQAAKKEGRRAGKLMAQRRGAGEAPLRSAGWDPVRDAANAGQKFKASAIAGSTPKSRPTPVGMRGSASDRHSWTSNRWN